MGDLKHGYWIPTNRACGKALASYCAEVSRQQIATGAEIPILIADSGNEQIESANAGAIAEARAAYPDLRIIHLTWSRQADWINRVCQANGSPSLAALFLPRGVDYGAAMNRIFLLSAGFGFDAIHRRDSDTILQPGCPFPLEKEMQLLGTTPPSAPLDERIALVGGGYVGEWNLDLKAFWNKDPKLFNLFLDCLWVPAGAQAEYIAETVEGCTEVFRGDADAYHRGGAEKTPEAGNFSLLELHEHFPCLPAAHTLAGDYFTFKMSHMLGCPSVFHARRVVHEYHTGRRSGPSLRGYARSLAKFCDHSPVYWRFLNVCLKPLRQAPDSPLGSFSRFKARPAHREMAMALREATQLVRPERIQKLDTFLSEFLPAVYPEEAAALSAVKDELFRECNEDYLNHATLIEAWPGLIQAAKEHSLDY